MARQAIFCSSRCSSLHKRGIPAEAAHGDGKNANAPDAVQLIVPQWQAGRLRVRRKVLVLGVGVNDFSVLSESSLAAGRRRLSTRRAREPFVCCCWAAAGLLLSYNSPRYRGLRACLPLSPSLSSSSSSQCTPPPPNAALPPPPPLLSQYHQKLHTLLAVWSQRHLTSALPLLLLLLLCPARPIGHTPNPHPAPVAPKQQQQQLSAPDLPPAQDPLLCLLCCSSRPLAQQQAPASPHPTDQAPTTAPQPAPASSRLSPSYTPIAVLGCLLACLCVVRRYASLQLLLACLLAACCAGHHRAAHHSSSTSSPLRNAAPRAPPDLLLRRRRQQRGRLSSA